MKLKAKYRPELICSKDATRFVLTEPHVKVIKGKPSLCATDGRRLLVIPIEAEKSEFGTLPKDAIRLARSTRQDKRQDNLHLNLNGCITLPNGWTLPRPKQEDFSNFPNVEQVIPNPDKQTCVVSFDAKLLYELSQAMGVRQVVLKFQDKGSAITVTSPREEAYGVLMPMRIE
jgi:DNA polymerase III sliding clamp (beta) subunit (PCNA family)